MKTNSNLGLKRLAENAAVTFGRQLTAGLLQLMTVVIIARALGPNGNGQYVLALLLPTLLATFLNFGIAPANVYFLGSGKISPTTVFQAISRLTLFITITGLGVGALSITFYGENWFPNVPQIYLWCTLLIFPFMLLQSFLSSIFQGLQMFKVFNLVLLTQPAVTLILILTLVLFDNIRLEYLLAAHLIGFVFMVFISLYKIRTEVILKTPEPMQQGYITQAISYGYKAHLSNILTFINYKADIFLVNFFLTPTAVGIYVVAVQVVERLWLVSHSVSTIILPHLAKLSNNESQLKQVTPIVCRTVIAITFLSAIILSCGAYPLISLLFGIAYLKAVLILILLLPGIIAGAGARILANDIAARGRPELNMYFSIIVVGVNITGNVFLIPTYGLEGAAVATSVAYLLNFLLRLIVYKKISGNRFKSSILITTEDITKFVNILKNK